MMLFIELKRRGLLEHEVLVYRDGEGRRRRRYLKKGWRENPKLAWILRELERRQLAKTLRMVVARGERGRPRTMPKELAGALAEAGYRMKAGRLLMISGRFFTSGCASSRFAMLSGSCKDAVGSSEALLALERTAFAQLKAVSRRGVRGAKFEDLVADVLAARLSSPAARLRNDQTPPRLEPVQRLVRDQEPEAAKPAP